MHPLLSLFTKNVSVARVDHTNMNLITLSITNHLGHEFFLDLFGLSDEQVRHLIAAFGEPKVNYAAPRPAWPKDEPRVWQ